MSDAVDDFHAWQLLKKSKTNPLRERMQEFLSDHELEADLKDARKKAVEGDDLSDLVIEDRDERL